jgi:hypothetical protein
MIFGDRDEKAPERDKSDKNNAKENVAILVVHGF